MPLATEHTPTPEEIQVFVIAAHGRPDVAMASLADNPALLHTRWERTGETALDGAGQTGQRELAEHLLAAGAPLDIVVAAMLGWRDHVVTSVDAIPALVDARPRRG